MKNHLALAFSTTSLALAMVLLPGCSGDDDAAEGGAPAPAESALVTKLAACPVVQTSEDPAASACLEGTYEGKTLAGEACTLTIRGGGAYDFASPALTYTYAPSERTIRVFSHGSTSNTHQVGWRISDPVQTGTSYELKFDAAFGEYTPAGGKKIDFEATRSVDGARSSSSCTLAL